MDNNTRKIFGVDFNNSKKVSNVVKVESLKKWTYSSLYNEEAKKEPLYNEALFVIMKNYKAHYTITYNNSFGKFCYCIKDTASDTWFFGMIFDDVKNVLFLKVNSNGEGLGNEFFDLGVQKVVNNKIDKNNLTNPFIQKKAINKKQ